MITHTTTLYQRLGGEQLTSAMITEFIDRMHKDDQINHHFVGLDTELLRKHVIAYFNTYIFDGPGNYLGPSLKKAHAGLHVTSEEYDIGIQHLHTALKHHAVTIQDISTIEARLRMIKPHIINQ